MEALKASLAKTTAKRPAAKAADAAPAPAAELKAVAKKTPKKAAVVDEEAPVQKRKAGKRS